jgi:hypothetical protein
MRGSGSRPRGGGEVSATTYPSDFVRFLPSSRQLTRQGVGWACHLPYTPCTPPVHTDFTGLDGGVGGTAVQQDVLADNEARVLAAQKCAGRAKFGGRAVATSGDASVALFASGL